MQLRFFTIPVVGGEAAADELNRFLGSQRILSVDRHLGQDGGTLLWAICVGYEAAGSATDTAAAPKRGKVDFREVLSEADFAIYAQLRTLRKELAEREGVPPYNLFTNEQLAAIVTRPATSLADLGEIQGIGAARIDKYGRTFLDALAAARATAAPAAAASPGEGGGSAP
ncbi:MAG: HRDC domain-containing protein [Thiohalocapsa sp.]|uniref:HRDC domain-containing protein n=1 Tax=Thiohalocapsa sp. TaxID=2497641 RepID=UPI0025E21A03|nr:HRDC domain-containing protein [Thiohalocapsa sp.]MCG6943539.1 HRDC domain-containing protein [Thiohalocapsa sp.]